MIEGMRRGQKDEGWSFVMEGDAKAEEREEGY